MSRGLHWFRNDLRLADNSALAALWEVSEAWLPVFVLDPRLLRAVGNASPRVCFLMDCLDRLARVLHGRGVPLLVREGRPERVLPRLLHETGASLLSFNADVSPFARRRDAAVRRAVERRGSRTLVRSDRTIFGADDIRTTSGGPYAVYTPYRRAWWRRFEEEPVAPLRMPRMPPPIPGVGGGRPAEALPGRRGREAVAVPTGGEAAARRRLAAFLERRVGSYHEARDLPAVDGTSRLSAHLRFGTLSPRVCVEQAREAAAADPRRRRGAAKWLDELLWREFYSAILEAHPRVLRESFRREYDRMAWNDDAQGFSAWCEGRTGYPIVDAGMRQLAATGWMHNRVRMIVASFLTKDLLIDWREGERFFFRRLVDGEPASNNGGWQWAASTGTDPQPYFRIFHPVAQGRRHDPAGDYVRRWVPELRSVADAHIHAPWEAPSPPGTYPPPIVDHAARRIAALERYRAARSDPPSQRRRRGSRS